METSDWRTQLPKDFRENIIKKIIDILKKRTPPFDDPSSQLKKIQSVALKFEEKVYMDSSDQREYVRKIMVKLMAAEGSHPNIVSKSSSNSPCASNPGQSISVQSTDQSQACEVTEQHLLLDVQNNKACAGVSANMAPTRSTVGASSQNPLKLVGNSLGKGIHFNESASNIKQEQVQQHSSRIDSHPNPHHCRQVKQEYIDLQENLQHQNPNLCKQVKQEHVALSRITQQHQLHHQKYNDPQKNHQQLNPNLCKYVKQGHVTPSCITQQHQVHQQHHYQQKLLKNTQQLIPPQSAIKAPILRPSDSHIAPLSDLRQDQISPFKQTSQSLIKNHHQTAFVQTNPHGTPEHLLLQSQKQARVITSRLTPTNLQQNHINGKPNGLRDLHQQHHRLSSQNNSLLQEFKGQSIIRPSANHEAQRNNISVLHESSQLPEGGSSGKRQCEIKIQGETSQIASTFLPNQVQESQPQNLQRQLNSQSQPKQMPSLPSSRSRQMSDIPASTCEQGISNVNNLQEQLYRKVEVLKEKYLSALTGIYQKIACHFEKLNSIPQHPDNIKKLKAMKHMHYTAKYYIMNLSVPKSKITSAFNEKLGLLEDKIVSFINIFDQHKRATLLQHRSTSNVDSMPQSVQLHSQASQGKTRQDENKLQSQSVNLQCIGTNMQHGSMTNVVNDYDSLSEPPILQHDMAHLRQKLTEQDSEKANSLTSVMQVPSESCKLPRGSPQQPNNILSQNPAVRIQQDAKTPNQELQRHKSQRQLVQPKQQVPQQHHQSPELQSGDSTSNSLPISLKPSSQRDPHSSVIEKTDLPLLPTRPTLVISRSSPEDGISSLAPSDSAPVPGDSEKPMSETSLVSYAVNIGGQLSHDVPKVFHTSLDGLNAAEQPIQRLIKMVNLVSSKALSSFASDISSVVCRTDRMSGPDMVQRSGAAIGDLADMTYCHQERYFTRQETTVETRIMKRPRSMPISIEAPENGSMNESLLQYLQLSDMEKFDLDAPAVSYSKRRRLQVNHLLQEITAINQRLIDTVLDIIDDESITSVPSAPILDGKGIIVRCSFVAVTIAPSLNSEQGSDPMFPIQPLRLLVPANYPLCSPIFMDKLKVEVSDDQDLSAQVRSKLDSSLRQLTEPLSLGEIARTWDVCARAVISEYAEQNGGGSFSSRYGTWEDCLSAAAA
ncbi:mediator of RNA polymerase II transcription subunit 15a-like [Argentina anserina]|uniref:mediator of RNA polymerase II transcription subunit 15a-like n=1 Tax=Argentina anserina TaxID=57926 RepID=UPI0021763682|nr:mediator of RNA polymerase II transcription subunit 15a-like [Potentilla anserina]